MLTSIARTFRALVLSMLGIASAVAGEETADVRGLSVRVGDLVVQKDANGWSAVKVLAVDAQPDGSATAHCLVYKSASTKPDMEALRNAPVLAWHAPINARSFGQGWERIGNQATAPAELAGFVEYLKLTDFPRYLALTKQDLKEVVSKANEHYKRAYALGDIGKRVEAIVAYGNAIDLFPLFYEAMDNRAFTYMELGRFREALSDFEQSLRVNPEGMAAFFSKGECLMKLGDLKAAEAVFLEGQSRFPQQRTTFTTFLERVRALQRNG